MNLNLNVVFPGGAFAPLNITTAGNYLPGKYRKVLNIQTHFNAIPDDASKATQNTQAFRAAFDFIRDRQMEYTGGANCEAPSAQWIIYVPDGVYWVNDTLSYTGSPYTYFRGVRLIGQSRTGTVIRLTNNCAGFGSGSSPKAVLSFERSDQTFNNWQGHNMLKNMTINVGSGNAGAVGVDFYSANTGRIDNVAIRSSSGPNEWAGAIGLHFRIGIVHGFVSNVTIDGFDVGIQLDPYHMCNPALEHITLMNQKVAGIKALNGGASLRYIRSTQSRAGSADATGILIDSGSATSAGSHIVVVDSDFISSRTPASSKPAINLVGHSGVTGFLFARGIDAEGYIASVVKDGGVEVAGDLIDEYVSARVWKFNSSHPTPSMNMTIEDYPKVDWVNDMTDWVSPEQYGAVGDGVTDDSTAIQNALNSGKSVVYFPKQQYALNSMVAVPATVKRIEFLATELTGNPTAYFDVNVESSMPLLISDLNDGVAPLVRLSNNRTLVLDSNRASNVRNYTTGQKIFVNNGNKFLKVQGSNTTLKNMKAWCRFLNTEDKNYPNWTVDTGGALWVLGYKCEGATINFQVQDGGHLEVLGGIANQYTHQDQVTAFATFNANAHPYDAPVVNVDGNVSYTGITNGPNSATAGFFENMVGSIQNNTIRMLWSSNVEPRLGRPNQFVVPLYNCYDPNNVP